MKKTSLSIALLVINYISKADETDDLIAKYKDSGYGHESSMTEVILPILIIVVLSLIVSYFFLRFTFSVNKFMQKIDYNNKLLELIATKKEVTQQEILDLQFAAIKNPSEKEILEYNSKKNDAKRIQDNFSKDDLKQYH